MVGFCSFFRLRFFNQGKNEKKPRQHRSDPEHDPRIEARADRDERVVLQLEGQVEKKKARRENDEPGPGVAREFHRFSSPRSFVILRLRSSLSLSHLPYAARSM